MSSMSSPRSTNPGTDPGPPVPPTLNSDMCHVLCGRSAVRQVDVLVDRLDRAGLEESPVRGGVFDGGPRRVRRCREAPSSLHPGWAIGRDRSGCLLGAQHHRLGHASGPPQGAAPGSGPTGDGTPWAQRTGHIRIITLRDGPQASGAVRDDTWLTSRDPNTVIAPVGTSGVFTATQTSWSYSDGADTSLDKVIPKIDRGAAGVLSRVLLRPFSAGETHHPWSTAT